MFSCGCSVAPIHSAALDHQFDRPRVPDVDQRIRPKDDDVGQLPCRDRPARALRTQHRRRIARRALQRLRCTQTSEAHQQLQLSMQIRQRERIQVRVTQRVRTSNDRHPTLMRKPGDRAAEPGSGSVVAVDEQRWLEHSAASNHLAEHGVETGILDRERHSRRCTQRGLPMGRVHRHREQRRVRDRIDARRHHVHRHRGVEGGMRPHPQALRMRLRRDPSSKLAIERCVELDRRGPSALRFRHGFVNIGRVTDRSHPRHLPGNEPTSRVVGPRIGEEVRSSEQHNEVDVRARDRTAQRVAP